MNASISSDFAVSCFVISSLLHSRANHTERPQRLSTRATDEHGWRRILTDPNPICEDPSPSVFICGHLRFRPRVDRISQLAPRPVAADERPNSRDPSLLQEERRTGARGFVWSGTV